MATFTDLMNKKGVKKITTNTEIIDTLNKEKKNITKYLKEGYTKTSILEVLNELYKFEKREVRNPNSGKMEKIAPKIFAHHLNKFLKTNNIEN
jgi:hypothetical protein